MFGRVGVGTEGVSEDMQVIARIMRQDTQDDVMNHWRTRGRPRIEARVAESLSTGQFDTIPGYLDQEFNRNIEPLNKGYDASIDPLDQDEAQLGDMLRAMQASSRALVGTAATRVVEEIALRYTGPEGTRSGGLVAINDGLKEGEKVITAGVGFLKDGDKVDVAPALATGGATPAAEPAATPDAAASK